VEPLSLILHALSGEVMYHCSALLNDIMVLEMLTSLNLFDVRGFNYFCSFQSIYHVYTLPATFIRMRLRI